jgi:hypothetical protein
MGITLPFDPRTLPNLTDTQRIRSPGQAARINSPKRLVQPMTFVGFTALSEEIIRKVEHFEFSATFSNDSRPKTLLPTASSTLSSMTGTCL